MIDDEKTTLTDAFLTGKAALYRYIATFFVQHEEIEDTLQQTYVDALSSQQEKGVRIDSPKACLFRVARNITLNKKNASRSFFSKMLASLTTRLPVGGSRISR